MSVPPEPYGWRLALMLSWGERHKAAHLLESLNRIQRAFDFPEFDMPEAATTDLPELVTCPAETRVRVVVERELRTTIEMQRKVA